MQNTVALDGRMQKNVQDSDGNLVNVGNADSDGTNVNGNRPDNRNDNLGVSLSRSVPKNSPIYLIY